MYEAIIKIFEDGNYNEDGDFVLDCEPWDGKGDPPVTSEPLALKQAYEAIRNIK